MYAFHSETDEPGVEKEISFSVESHRVMGVSDECGIASATIAPTATAATQVLTGAYAGEEDLRETHQRLA